MYAAKQGISLTEGYIVWVVDGDCVNQGGYGKWKVFGDLAAATALAERHSADVRVFVTGPRHQECLEIPRRKSVVPKMNSGQTERAGGAELRTGRRTMKRT